MGCCLVPISFLPVSLRVFDEGAGGGGLEGGSWGLR